MIRQFLACGLTCLVMFASNVCGAQADRDFDKISVRLLPETRSWTPISALRPADEAYLRANEAKLKEAYSAAKIKTGLESEYCSFIERIFSDTWGFPKGFYVGDLDADGSSDVVYTGGAMCAEGNATVVWYCTTTGFVVKQPSIELSKVLRVKEGSPPRLSTVAVACCAGQIDDYFLGALVDSGFDVQKKWSVDIKTLEPIDEDKQPAPLQGKESEPNPKSSPNKNDERTPSALRQ